VGAEFSRRLAEDAFEHAIELRKRLETYVVGDFANAADNFRTAKAKLR
jgi:hypothetical protein